VVQKKGTALLMVFVDIDPEHDADFNAWYNEEHVADLLKLPGFLNAARYEASKGGPRYLACYELESAEAKIGERLMR
jgi:antibiotic biosynthesis monooxygenase (ABM) superfamily enzyme